MEGIVSRNVIALDAAEKVAAAAAVEANEVGVPACIAVSDSAGHIVMYLRMDGAPLLSARIAQDKAYTVAAFNGLPTHEWWRLINDDPALRAGIVHTEGLVIFAGGIPLRVDCELVGAIGVSGGTTDQDQRIAEAGAAALSK